ncbi:unnamed protein product [Callosobruchus maculatus]|uniref:Uncharacterized protein n=1 Tax=Callosobruchus maculatus TaxID=64391 RepID=A0A653CCZ3_CALMS|nr:unnamed protein product [Callosobruchus maculatus]
MKKKVDSKHVKIIVPSYHHTHNIHHHHVKTVHVPVPVIKKVYVHEEPHIIHHDHHDHHDWCSPLLHLRVKESARHIAML